MIPGLLFPHDSQRDIQKKFMEDVWNCINTKRHMIAHAPTGLGKTVAALAPALTFALKENKTIFFLTSRHTQHKIALETLSKIKQKHGLSFVASSLIGKKWMCAQPGAEAMGSGEFSEYCKYMREKDQCEMYLKTRKKSGGAETAEAAIMISDLGIRSPLPLQEVIEGCRQKGLCPYEVAQMLAQQATVIVTDYYYVFHPRISENFLKKVNKDLSNCILIIDEGHNLPSRIRETLSSNLSNFQIQSAIKEAIKHSCDQTREALVKLQDGLNLISEGVNGQEPVEREEILKAARKIMPIDLLIELFENDATTIRATQRGSSIGAIAEFLLAWQGDDEGFARYVTIKETTRGPLVTFTYRCLDPSVVTKPIIDSSFMTLLMSGTLTPTEMYSDLLGFNRNTFDKEYGSPFDEKNRLTLINPSVTTKYTSRSDEQYKKIAVECASIINAVPGNTAVFFPSYYLLEKTKAHLDPLSKKTMLCEASEMSSNDKKELLEKFVTYAKSGSALLGVAAGSFGEGIDLPGDQLKCVIVVGLPLSKPDIETQQLITYYNEKFGKGWDYGYILPALTKVLQNAGRCIRTETDRGVVVFLDDRYGQPQYMRGFPTTWDIKTTKDCAGEITVFFGGKKEENKPVLTPKTEFGDFVDASDVK